MNITGKLVEVRGTEKVSPDFSKRVLVINDCALIAPQNIPFELSNERIPLIDGFRQGDMVSISYNMRAKDWVDRSGKTRTFITLHAWEIKSVSNETETTPFVEEKKETAAETAAVMNEPTESAN